MVTAALSPTVNTTPAAPVDSAWVRATAATIRDTLQESRSTWQVWHVRAEAQRRVRTADLPGDQVETVVDLLVDEVLTTGSVRITRAQDDLVEPVELRRRDGSSVYEVAGSALFTSPAILAAEQHLVEIAGRRDGHIASEDAVAIALLEQAANGVTLNAGQSALVRGMATSGARLQLAIAPAGAGKTTAMRALAAAWTTDGGTVIGLGPVRGRGRGPARAARRRDRHPGQAHLVHRPRRPTRRGRRRSAPGRWSWSTRLAWPTPCPWPPPWTSSSPAVGPCVSSGTTSSSPRSAPAASCATSPPPTEHCT